MFKEGNMADLYHILGVSNTASAAEIKKAYHKIARTCHPDVAKNDPKAADKFKEASVAYEILSDEKKRRQYDAGEIDEQGRPRGFAGAYGHNNGAYSGNPFGGGFPGGRSYTYKTGGNEQFQEFDINDIFSMFGGSMGGTGMGGNPFGFGSSNHYQRYTAPGQDVSYELTIPFKLAALGGETSVRLNSGKQIKVKIPAGIKDGATLRLKGQGLSSQPNGPSGDALIKIHIASDSIFTREDNNVLMDLPITLKEAVLGAKIAIPTLSGKVSLTIPPNISSGKILRLKGKGIAGKGDLLVKIQIILPDKPDNDLEDFIKSWHAKSQNPRPKF